ncbi:MAG TPA: hypothetical protein DCF33_15935 [Saprospirales bacterium]|nr:hypothetical protein [Saprospirales bacterium]
MKNLISILVLLLVTPSFAFAHGDHDKPVKQKSWTISTEKRPVEATFLLSKNDTIYLENAGGKVLQFPLMSFSEQDQQWIKGKIAQIEQLNHPKATPAVPSSSEETGWVLWVGLAFFSFASWFLWKRKRPIALTAMLLFSAVLFGFKNEIERRMLGTDPLFVNSAFEPFKPKVATHWDNTWFYVESKGIPDHEMMTGIIKWQQQVPIPQCYLGSNAWQIPLNPELAAVPVPVNDQHFLRGAVAIAANGVPIFNPHTNTGVDAFLDGQLDAFGGHSGRADDYHYHTAPLHLDAQTTDILPIAFALDGFAVYGNQEPDGSPMLPLDDNHGHFDAAGVYHYHGTPEAPYMIGAMVGKVTEDATLQIIPQAKATPVRPSLTPLNGAVITDCTPKAGGNGYTLTYTRNGQTYQVDYSWTPGGVYTYQFISPTGTTTETYNGFLPCEVPTAVEDLAVLNNNVLVSPNPVSGSTSLKIISLNDASMMGVKIFDANGRLVFQQENPGETLETGNLARGVYFLKIMLKQGEISRKIIVQ